MSAQARYAVGLVLSAALFTAGAWAQKSGTGSSSSSTASRPTTTTGTPTNTGNFPTSTPSTPQQQMMFISGKVMMDDGSAIPRDVTVERLCNSRVVQQTHASPNGSFSLEIGSMVPSPIFDGSAIADADPSMPRSGAMGGSSGGSTGMGFRRDLANCELQAYSPGFRSSAINLVEYNSGGSVIDVGSIVLQRGEKVQGTTLSATVYGAPKEAKKAYQKGMEAESKGKLPEAKNYFQKAVEIYPKHADAWLQLGRLAEHDNDTEGARKAYSSALAADSRFVPPYLRLAAMSFRAAQWNDVLNYSGHALELDPLSYPEAHFYQAVANLSTDRVESAEKSARTAERLDVHHRIPQIHLVLGDILARRQNYHDAIGEMETYLKLAPNAKDAEIVRSHLSELQRDEASAQTSKP